MFVVAAKPTAVFQNVEKRLRERHSQVLEIHKARASSACKDFNKIYREDVEFARKLVDDVLPVEITVNEKFWDNMPFVVRQKPKKNDIVELYKKEQPSTTADAELAESLD